MLLYAVRRMSLDSCALRYPGLGHILLLFVYTNYGVVGCCEMLVFRVCGVRQIFYVFSLYRNPDLDDQIFYCLQTSMAAVQSEDVRASFLFVGDLNGHH